MSPLRPAPMSAIVAHYLTTAEEDIRICEDLYQRGTRVHSFWVLTDLSSSASYRLLAGDANAYVRVEIFTRALRRMYDCYGDVELLKELGDAILLRSSSLRPVLEVTCVYDALSRLWNSQRYTPRDVSLTARTTITFGAATRLDRPEAVDYIGTPLDRLARLASQTVSSDVLCLIEDEALTQDRKLIGDEYPFLSATGPSLLSETKLKPGEQPIRYWQVGVDHGAFRDYDQYFVQLREQASITNR